MQSDRPQQTLTFDDGVILHDETLITDEATKCTEKRDYWKNLVKTLKRYEKIRECQIHDQSSRQKLRKYEIRTNKFTRNDRLSAKIALIIRNWKTLMRR